MRKAFSLLLFSVALPYLCYTQSLTWNIYGGMNVSMPRASVMQAEGGAYQLFSSPSAQIGATLEYLPRHIGVGIGAEAASIHLLLRPQFSGDNAAAISLYSNYGLMNIAVPVYIVYSPHTGDNLSFKFKLGTNYNYFFLESVLMRSDAVVNSGNDPVSSYGAGYFDIDKQYHALGLYGGISVRQLKRFPHFSLSLDGKYVAGMTDPVTMEMAYIHNSNVVRSQTSVHLRPVYVGLNVQYQFTSAKKS